MLSRRGPILIVVSLLLAVGAAWLANRWLTAQTKPHETGPDIASVVVAAMDIPFGTTVEPRHVKVIQMFKDTVPVGAYDTADQVQGLVTRAPILEGELLLEPRFSEEGEGSTLASIVSENMRAMSVRVDDVVGVAGFILPGNFVDVVSAYQRGSETVSETVVQNVKVLAVDQTASSDKNEPVIVRAVTLEVTPADAERLVLAKQRGAIQLALRNPHDTQLAELKPPAPVTTPQTGPPAPPPAVKPRVRRPASPPATPGVTVIRGTEVDKEVPQTNDMTAQLKE